MNKKAIDTINGTTINKKKAYNKIIKTTKPKEIPGMLLKTVDNARNKYNDSNVKLTTQQKAVISQKLKSVGSNKKLKSSAINSIDYIIENSSLEKANEYKALKKKITSMKFKKMNNQKRDMASKIFVSITHENKENKSKRLNKTKKSHSKKNKKHKMKKSKTIKKMKGGNLFFDIGIGLWDLIYYSIGDIVLFPFWLIADIVGVLLYYSVEMFQYFVGASVGINWDSLYKFLHISNGFNIEAPVDTFSLSAIENVPGELLSDVASISQHIPEYGFDMVKNDVVDETIWASTIAADTVLPYVEGIGELTVDIGEDVADTVSNTIYPTISTVFKFCLKVILGQTFLAALLTSIPVYLYYERESLQSAYENVSKYGWLISLFPMDIEADSNFYCENVIQLEDEMKKVDSLFDVEQILKTPRVLLEIINKLKINGRHLDEFREIIEDDLKNIDVNIFTKPELFEKDFEKFRKQVNISKNIDFTRKMITFKKKIIERTTELIVSIETMKQNGSFQENESLVRVLINNICDSIKETIKYGYSYCMEKSGHVKESSNKK